MQIWKLDGFCRYKFSRLKNFQFSQELKMANLAKLAFSNLIFAHIKFWCIITNICIYNKANIYRNTRKMRITMKTELCLERLLETLFLAIKMCTGFTRYVIWVNTKMYSVTSEPTQSSSRRVCPLSTHQRYLATERSTSQK